jgi:hypothetical protein
MEGYDIQSASLYNAPSHVIFAQVWPKLRSDVIGKTVVVRLGGNCGIEVRLVRYRMDLHRLHYSDGYLWMVIVEIVGRTAWSRLRIVTMAVHENRDF